jgi:large subunit ribosomal protein L19
MKKTIIQEFEQSQIKNISEQRHEKSFPKFSAGDTVSVKYKITEGSASRLQAFQGVVIAKSKSDNSFNANFTVRKISSGIGVERKFIVNSLLLSSIEVLKRGVVRRAKLYYLRNLTGKASRIKERLDFSEANTQGGNKSKGQIVEKPAEASKGKETDEVKKEEGVVVQDKAQSSKEAESKSKDSKEGKE